MKLIGGLLALFGLVLVAVGLILGLATVSRDGLSCGSAFSPQSATAASRDLTNEVNGSPSTVVADCSAATGDRKPIALAVTVAGGLLIAAGGLTAAAMYDMNHRTPRTPALP
ncbi:MAG TPA: hypothetical protein VGH54_10270 [Mycobacterium sp.]|jgi:hypothetical protein|uniref:hypothetical protein n=1 Tax=Mycobacterium sp. TaxID=1785 RepID=UPI002F42E30F